MSILYRKHVQYVFVYFPVVVSSLCVLIVLCLNFKIFAMSNNNIWTALLKLVHQNEPCLLATVIEAIGSTPQVPGSSAIIGKNGLITGTVGGGPLEYKVVCEAHKAVDSGLSRLISFDLAGNLTEGSDSICGGNMVVLMDASPEKHREVFEAILNSMDDHLPGILITFMEVNNDKNYSIRRLWFDLKSAGSLPGDVNEKVKTYVQDMSLHPKSGDFRVITDASGLPENIDFICLQSVVPPPSLVIAGAGHVGKAVARLGKFLGFEVTVWDDRPEYANKINIPEADFTLNGTVDEALEKIPVQSDSWLVIVTRGHKNDADVLRKWIKTQPAYLGMMGSRVKTAQIKQQFLEQDLATPEEWDRVHTPIGLKIGAKTVEEIAVSIAAELIQVKNSVI
jgi:xanthine dehydrogenase accessory factor